MNLSGLVVLSSAMRLMSNCDILGRLRNQVAERKFADIAWTCRTRSGYTFGIKFRCARLISIKEHHTGVLVKPLSCTNDRPTAHKAGRTTSVGWPALSQFAQPGTNKCMLSLCPACNDGLHILGGHKELHSSVADSCAAHS